MPKISNTTVCYLMDRWRMEFVRLFYIERDRKGRTIPGGRYHVTTTPGLGLAKAYQNPSCASRRAAVLNDEQGGRQRYVVLDEEQARIRERHMSVYRRSLKP